MAGLKRRAMLLGAGENLARLHASLGRGRGGIEYEFLGAIAPSQENVPLPVIGSIEDLPDVLGSVRPRRVDRHADSDLDEEELLQVVRRGASRGREGADRAEDDRAAHAARGVHPRSGRAAVRASPAGLRRHGFAVKRAFDIVVSGVLIVVGLPVWLLIAARDQAHVARAGLLPRPAHRPRRARVRDAQVPDDGRGRRRARSESSSARTRSAARCSRSATIRG